MNPELLARLRQLTSASALVGIPALLIATVLTYTSSGGGVGAGSLIDAGVGGTGGTVDAGPAMRSMPNSSLWPAPRTGSTTLDVSPASGTCTQVDGVGAFRTSCKWSKILDDDPIVYPGAPGASHIHLFFGNDHVDANTTTANIRDVANGSTCAGGTANKSAYWVPALIDGNGQIALPDDGSFSNVFYYKTGYGGVPAANVQPVPVGLRMIADMNRTSGGPFSQDGLYCEPPGGGAYPYPVLKTMPDCADGDMFLLRITFPQCWDGVNLDSVDHRSHMAYASGGCPPSHPVGLPEIKYIMRFPVDVATQGPTTSWYFASDMNPTQAAGLTMHADWLNGWDPVVMQAIVTNALNPGLDCHGFLIGDGTMVVPQ